MTDTKKPLDPRVIALIIVAVLVVGAIAYYGTKDGSAPAGGPGPAEAQGLSVEETEAMLAKLRELGPVPDEVPATIVIQDAARARAEQPFLENAADGDVIFLFTKEKMVFLYRPGTNAIIAAGPLNDGPPPPAGASAQ